MHYLSFPRFAVNIQDGSGPHAEIAFHFNVRFVSGNDRNEIVRNHCSQGQWGAEERSKPSFPFMPNGNFDMIILCEQNCFKVSDYQITAYCSDCKEHFICMISS